MKMVKEHDVVVLREDLPSENLQTGDVGTVVHVHADGAAYEVEFMTLSGRTIAVTTIGSDQLRAVTDRDLSHVRQLQPA
jgi:hypothetical protein